MFCAWSGAARELVSTPVTVGGDEGRRRLWVRKLRLLRPALDGVDGHVLLDVRLLRAARTVDAIVLMPGCIVSCTLREGQHHRDREAAEDAALDLYDFHAGSRQHAVVPLLVTAQASGVSPHRVLPLPGVTPLLAANAQGFGPLLRELAAMPGPILDSASWIAAPYQPVPGLIEAARSLYARHGVADLASAGADAARLRAVGQAIDAACADARSLRRPAIVFVTGVPGAGKTLCGLHAAFGGGATFLTGNPALVHVLREALARDRMTADRGSGALRAARQRMEAVIQALPAFRDAYAESGVPPERVVVIDEAQRCWTAPHAIAKTVLSRVKLTQSEPAHLLDIMSRRGDGPVIVCLVGGGQEIHDGEGGLAAWSAALRDRPNWRVHAPGSATEAADSATEAADPRQRLSTPPFQADDSLHLDLAVRSFRCRTAPAWVDALLAGDAARARQLADASAMPFTVVRDLAVLRACLRRACRGTRRAGLVASSGGRRLRAEGLGGTLPHDDPSAVARWFLDRFPDIRASDALEVATTEFFCQGLELRHYVSPATTPVALPEMFGDFAASCVSYDFGVLYWQLQAGFTQPAFSFWIGADGMTLTSSIAPNRAGWELCYPE